MIWRSTFTVAVLGVLGLSAAAHAAPKTADRFDFSADIGANGRYIDNLAFSKPSSAGLSLGARTEFNYLLHVKADIRYVEGRAFAPSEDRLFNVSASLRSPRLLFVSLDVFEVYYKKSTRLGDDLFYVNTGLGLGGNIAGSSLTVGLGFSYLNAADSTGVVRDRALGLYGGAEWMLRHKRVHANVRVAAFVALNQGKPYAGLLSDGDVTVRFPVGAKKRAWIGPRIDLQYRNLGFVKRSGALFGQRDEFAASLLFAVGVRVPKPG